MSETSPWRQRVTAELDDLYRKIVKMTEFIGSDDFDTLSDERQRLICLQCNAMALYADALKRRLDLAGLDTPTTPSFTRPITPPVDSPAAEA